MKIASSFLVNALLTIVGAVLLFQIAPSQASAGSLDNAALACYVDTFAYDQLVSDYCWSPWTPSTGNRSTTAHFEITGLPPGNYSYRWSRKTCGAGTECSVSIRVNQTIYDVAVKIQNLNSGETTSVFAVAEYPDGWN